MDTIDDVLAHFGVKGMKWGVRRSRSQLSGGQSHSEDALKALASKKIASTQGTHALSNQDLQHLVKRMQLEKQFSELGGVTQKKAGKKFVSNLLGNVGNQQANRVANVAATVAVNAAIAKAAARPGAHKLVGEVSKKLS